MYRSLAFLFVALFGLAFVIPVPSRADPTITQSGNVTNGHVPCFVSSGVVQDCGPATQGNSSEFGIVKNGGLPFCISSGRDPNPYVQLCLSISASQASIYINQFNGATVPPCAFVINGVSSPCAGGGGSTNTVRVLTSGASDTATTNDVTILWDSSAASAKTQNIYACSSASKANILKITDEYGNAGTYPISLVPSASTINGVSSFAMNTNTNSITLQCDGVNNWTVQ